MSPTKWTRKRSASALSARAAAGSRRTFEKRSIASTTSPCLGEIVAERRPLCASRPGPRANVRGLLERGIAHGSAEERRRLGEPDPRAADAHRVVWTLGASAAPLPHRRGGLPGERALRADRGGGRGDRRRPGAGL